MARPKTYEYEDYLLVEDRDNGLSLAKIAKKRGLPYNVVQICLSKYPRQEKGGKQVSVTTKTPDIAGTSLDVAEGAHQLIGMQGRVAKALAEFMAGSLYQPDHGEDLKARLTQFFEANTIQIINKMMNVINQRSLDGDLTIGDCAKAQTTLRDARETVLGRNPEIALQINNNEGMLSSVEITRAEDEFITIEGDASNEQSII